MKTILSFNLPIMSAFCERIIKITATKNCLLFLAVFCLLFLSNQFANAQSSSAILDLASNSKGVLIPRMTAAERSPGIVSPATGLLVYQTDGASGFYFNSGTAGAPNWVRINSGVTPIASGGTGQVTANASLNALLPSQTSQATKVLTTDGANTTWTTSNGGIGSVFYINTVNPGTAITNQVPIPYSPTNTIAIMPTACTCVAIYLEDETFTPAGASICTATLFKNGVATSLTVSVTSSATLGNKVVGSGAGSVTVAAGDKLSIGVSSSDPTKYIKMNVSLNCR